MSQIQELKRKPKVALYQFDRFFLPRPTQSNGPTQHSTARDQLNKKV